MPETPQVVIDIRDLSFQYPRGTTPAIKNINLQIHAGEYVVITGPTGSGKTTLAICLNSIIPQLVEGEYSGEVLVGDMKTAEHPVHELTAVVGMVFQNPEDQLFSLNVTDEVAFGVENMGYHRAEIIERVDAAIEKVGLVNRRNYSIFHLSGGQKQKVAIASNLAIAPQILVLDSPTADLDPISSREVVNTLLDLRAQEPSKTFIVVDSDISDVITLADRIIVMDNGEIVLDSSPVDLLLNHFHELDKLGIRMPDHIRMMHWLSSKFPELTDFYLEEEKVRQILEKYTSEGRLQFKLPADALPKHTHQKPVVQFNDVSFKYSNGPTILDHVSLDIQHGEFLAIVGENGTGKSTVMKLICGLIQPVSGVIETSGVNTTTCKLEDVLQHVGYLFQNPDNQLFMGTVEDEIAFGPRRRNCSPEEIADRVNEALDMMGLQDSRQQHPFTLSRGQRQRLAAATVLAARPKLLLLDEPTTGQDQVALDNLMHLTRHLIDDLGTSVIMVTHDMDLVARYATRMIVLDKGKILLDGNPLEIFSQKQDILATVSLKPPCMISLTNQLSQGNDCIPSYDVAVEGAQITLQPV
jgi:energy-coupling factor transport system ATP-binding protein